jgi:inner membrane protease subunit 1
MLPTFNYCGDWLFERKLSLSQLQGLKRGDLVTFRSPSNPLTLVCKRIIGLPGDVVNVDPIDLEMSKQHCLVPEGHVWVQGDNATASIDSRTYGPLPMGLIQAKIACRVRSILSKGALI